MWHVGIDLHRQTVVFAATNDSGEVRPPIRLDCSQTAEIVGAFEQLRPFRAVIEATRAYRWLFKLLSPLGRCCWPIHCGSERCSAAQQDGSPGCSVTGSTTEDQSDSAGIYSDRRAANAPGHHASARETDSVGNANQGLLALDSGAAQYAAALRLSLRPSGPLLV